MFRGTHLTQPTAQLSKILEKAAIIISQQRNPAKSSLKTILHATNNIDKTVQRRYLKVLRTVFERIKTQRIQFKNRKLRKSILYNIGRKYAFNYNTIKMMSRLHKKYLMPHGSFKVNTN